MARRHQPESPIRIVGYDQDGHLVDNLGRRQPTRFNAIWAIRAVPGLAQQFSRIVPGDFWSRDIDEDGNEVALIACPCGEQPELHPANMMVCECERCYLNLGDEIRVANSPKPVPPTTVEGTENSATTPNNLETADPGELGTPS